MSNDTPDNLAAEYIVGSMTHEERSQFTSELHRDTSLQDAVRSFDDTCEALFDSVTPVEPDAAIRTSLLNRIHFETTNADCHESLPAPTPSIRRSGDGDWREFGVPGARLRVLNIDTANNRMTALLRLAPGTEYPSHSHDQDEECYLLEGDLDFQSYRLKVGDYLRVEAGTAHGVSRTVAGCLCLITAAVPAWLAA